MHSFCSDGALGRDFTCLQFIGNTSIHNLKIENSNTKNNFSQQILERAPHGLSFLGKGFD